MAGVTLRNLTKTFGKVIAVNNVNLEIEDGEFMVLVGPSGCGKTTALRMIAGLEEVTSGEIYIGDRLVNDVSPKDRDIAMVFQNYALYPHMSVYDNMSFGLRLKRTPTGGIWPFNSKRTYPETEIRARVQEAAEMLGLTGLLHRKPRELSGGQRQRVALGRAIVREPKVFLMDEPLSNLDAKLRVQTRADLIKLHRRLGVTTIYVTHDQVEAMTMGDRIAVMSNGVVQQCDRPLTLYHHPANMFVAGFIGSPAMNFVPVRIVPQDGRLVADAGAFRVVLPPEQAERARNHVGQTCIFGIRPEHIYDKGLPGRVTPTPENTITVDVEVTEPLGNDIEMHLRVGDTDRTEKPGLSTLQSEDAAGSAALREQTRSVSLIARIDSASRARMGDRIEVVLDLSQSHLFDKDTEAALY
ncbi:MAG: sn-glycerol-3-phosphate ABC transporter ATP-binding protein UgpC [Chloroherpetonaceae bacterium]|nr:sn-glycerol-3-phosphate ABC transporter ATP-binding protein UgpC [Chthonomonadaceae bacterium]MDW8206982.1 sn-glycerol-3-phosphate ABC transporter ATP-binding protein UgpC [Chloroherpetonaceae bacterium]